MQFVSSEKVSLTTHHWKDCLFLNTEGTALMSLQSQFAKSQSDMPACAVELNWVMKDETYFWLLHHWSCFFSHIMFLCLFLLCCFCWHLIGNSNLIVVPNEKHRFKRAGIVIWITQYDTHTQRTEEHTLVKLYAVVGYFGLYLSIIHRLSSCGADSHSSTNINRRCTCTADTSVSAVSVCSPSCLFSQDEN